MLQALYNAIINLIEGPVSLATITENLDKQAAEYEAREHEKLDWRNSIVDLEKLVDAPSSLGDRINQAKELGYTGKATGEAEMNIFLHARLMEKLATTRV